jgi:site-specific DNA recombinase
LNNTVTSTGEKNLIKDPDRFQILRRMWVLMLTGLHTPPKILELVNNDWGFRTRQTRKTGGKPLCRSAIYHIFNNPFYSGWFESPKGSGQWHKGKHEPMVTKQEYDRVQVLLGRNGNPRPSIHTDFPFTGFIRCGECQSMVTAEEKHQLVCTNCHFKFAYRHLKECPRCKTPIENMVNPKIRSYTYYHCTKSKNPHCSQKSISSKKIEDQIDALLSHIHISEHFKDYALKYLRLLHEKESTNRDEDIDVRNRSYKACLQRIDNLIKLKTAPENGDGSLLSNEEYGRQRADLLNEKSRLEELLHDTGHRVTKWLELSEHFFEFASTAREDFTKGDSKTKKRILATIGSNFFLQDKQLKIEAIKPFEILENALTSQDSKKDSIEPDKIVSLYGLNPILTVDDSHLLGGVDDVRTLQHNNDILVNDIYRFFRTVCLSHSFNLSDWWLLYHAPSMDVRNN